MKPGRELDTLVAEKVMGWERTTLYGETDWWKTPDGREIQQSNVCPYRYSTDIFAARDVVEKVKEFEKFPYAICLAALKAAGVDIE